MTLGELYKKKYRLMLWHAQKYIGVNAAADIVHDAFLKLAKQNDKNETDLERILLVTVINECKNHLKHNKIVTKYIHRIEYQDEDAELINIEFDFLNIVYKKIKLLPKKCRRCIELFYFEEMNTTEISIELGISISAVTSQISRGRQLLKSYF